MSTNRSIGRTARKSKKDRSPNLCAFTFADGRQCRTPRRSGHLHLCYFHAQKEAESLAAKQAGKDISTFFFANLLTACDLSAAMARLFTAVAQGQIKPKVAGTLAYLSQTMLQSIPIAQHEYCEAFGTEPWRKAEGLAVFVLCDGDGLEHGLAEIGEGTGDLGFDLALGDGGEEPSHGGA